MGWWQVVLIVLAPVATKLEEAIKRGMVLDVASTVSSFRL